MHHRLETLNFQFGGCGGMLVGYSILDNAAFLDCVWSCMHPVEWRIFNYVLELVHFRWWQGFHVSKVHQMPQDTNQLPRIGNLYCLEKNIFKLNYKNYVYCPTNVFFLLYNIFGCQLCVVLKCYQQSANIMHPHNKKNVRTYYKQ